MRLSSRRSDADADVIRARLRALLEERPVGGWVPDDDTDREDVSGHDGEDADDEDTDGEDPDGEPHRAGMVGPQALRQQPRDPGEQDHAGMPGGIGRHRAPGRAARWDPGRAGARSLWLAGLVAALLLLGWTWLDRPVVEPAPPAVTVGDTLGRADGTPTPSVGEAAGTSEAVVVSVVGLVARPGLVTLPPGARVAEAVEAAGGLLPEADPASINLAAVVTDGAQIAVGMPGAGPVAEAGVGAAAAGGGGSLVDLNTAAAGDLDALPGLGPVLAQRIVDHRTRNGPFRSVEELDDVPGIGPTIAAELAGRVGV